MDKIDLSKPKWDQNTYLGRAKHFLFVTNPLNLLLTSKDLDNAKELVEQHMSGKTPNGVTENDLWRAKYRYDSAFHPDTKEKMFFLGRMSAIVPANMLISGCMLAFYKSTPAVIFWQWFNQSFNAGINYTNRSGDANISTEKLAQVYVAATSGAVITALSLKRAAKKMPPLVARFVPFAAVAAANCINIPLMRSNEIQHGIPIKSESGEVVGNSSNAAKTAISQVVLSRISMAVPGMFIPPIIMEKKYTKELLKKRPYLNLPIIVFLVGFFSCFATPLCCAFFPQESSLKTSSLESEVQEQVKKIDSEIDRVYFNKGL